MVFRWEGGRQGPGPGGRSRGWPAGRRRWAARPWSSEQGFLLPLASGGALLLLLSCLSLQSLIWGRQLEGRGAWQQRQIDDLLGSAAQRLAVALNRSHRCLLLLPSPAWPPAGSTPPGCDTPIHPEALIQGLPAGERAPQGEVRLLRWQPPQPTAGSAPGAAPPSWGELILALDGGGPASPVQRRYRLLLEADPPRVAGVQGLDP